MPHVMTADHFDGQAGLRVSTIDFSHPWEWLRKGWADVRAAPGYSLTYGTGIVLLSLLITTLMILGELTFLVPFLIAGFFLMAPMLSIGLYQMSAHLERGESLESCQALEAFRRNQGQLGMVAAFLFVSLQAWLVVSLVSIALLFDDPFPTLDNFLPVVFFSGDHLLLLATITVIGAGFAAVVFGIMAITVPLLTDRHVDALTAMRTSVRAVTQNPGPTLLWAGLIVLIVGAGLATFYLGLFIAIPLVGHASWHAYRDLVPSS